MPQKLNEVYGLKHPRIGDSIPRGYSAQNYPVQDGNDFFFLKGYAPRRDVVRIKEIHSAEQFFAERDIPAIVAIPTRNMDSIFEHHDRYWSLYPFVSAFHIESPLTLPTIRHANDMGHTLATLHQAGAFAPKNITTKRIESKKRMSFSPTHEHCMRRYLRNLLFQIWTLRCWRSSQKNLSLFKRRHTIHLILVFGLII